jgi:predicted alpha/beta-hydrolase family hydrolase
MMETYAFTIPSLHDDTPLDCRIYCPEDLHSTSHGLSGAIIAHAYPPLGGSQDDHVLLALTESLLKAGRTVATFNFRYVLLRDLAAVQDLTVPIEEQVNP